MASDAEHARRVGEHIETGMVYINEPAATSAELPLAVINVPVSAVNWVGKGWKSSSTNG